MAEEEEDLEGAAEENEEEVSMKEGRGGGERMEGKWKGEEGQRGEERGKLEEEDGGGWGERGRRREVEKLTRVSVCRCMMIFL